MYQIKTLESNWCKPKAIRLSKSSSFWTKLEDVFGSNDCEEMKWKLDRAMLDKMTKKVENYLGIMVRKFCWDLLGPVWRSWDSNLLSNRDTISQRSVEWSSGYLNFPPLVRFNFDDTFIKFWAKMWHRFSNFPNYYNYNDDSNYFHFQTNFNSKNSSYRL